MDYSWYVASLVTRPHLQGGKGSGTHQALFGVHMQDAAGYVIVMKIYRFGMVMYQLFSFTVIVA